MKVCSKCKSRKSFTEFARCTKHKDGLQSHCKSCNKIARLAWYARHHKEQAERSKRWAEAHPQRMKELQAAWHLSNQERVRFTKLFSKYRITKAGFTALLEKQSYQCPGCLIKLGFNSLSHVDHCHKTKMVRGILCRACNIALGLVKDNVIVLERLSNYLNNFIKPDRK